MAQSNETFADEPAIYNKQPQQLPTHEKEQRRRQNDVVDG